MWKESILFNATILIIRNYVKNTLCLQANITPNTANTRANMS